MRFKWWNFSVRQKNVKIILKLLKFWTIFFSFSRLAFFFLRVVCFWCNTNSSFFLDSVFGLICLVLFDSLVLCSHFFFFLVFVCQSNFFSPNNVTAWMTDGNLSHRKMMKSHKTNRKEVTREKKNKWSKWWILHQ